MQFSRADRKKYVFTNKHTIRLVNSPNFRKDAVPADRSTSSTNKHTTRTVQDLCESRGGRPGLSVLTSLLVSVDVKIY